MLSQENEKRRCLFIGYKIDGSESWHYWKKDKIKPTTQFVMEIN